MSTESIPGLALVLGMFMWAGGNRLFTTCKNMLEEETQAGTDTDKKRRRQEETQTRRHTDKKRHR